MNTEEVIRRRITDLENELIRNQLLLNCLDQTPYPREIGGICHVSYLASANKRILFLGENHMPSSGYTAFDLLKFYVNRSPFYLDVFIECAEDSSSNVNTDSFSTLNKARHYFLNPPKSNTLPYKFYPFDPRVSLGFDKFFLPKNKKESHRVYALCEDLFSQFSNSDELKEFMIEQWNNHPMIVESRQKLNNKMMEGLVFKILLPQINHPTREKFDRNWPILSRGDEFQETWMYILRVISVLADWTCILGVLAAGGNCVVYAGDVHTTICSTFFKSIGFTPAVEITEQSCSNVLLPEIAPLFE
jgi:hypothetical protein